MKVIIVVLLVLVIISLFGGLFFMYKDKGNSKRAVNALTIRVALSIAIIVILICGYVFHLFPQ
ncbi:MAG: twin transmembrane helix small protein [Betaproteobacteria bacterium]|nr:twin transmembrane helix small protein [Betaproteobacteria bacterium]